jgi:hypothetical protein
VTNACGGGTISGISITTSGADSLSTTTDGSGNYTLILSKKGTYTITAHTVCGDLSQNVTVTTCGLTTANINFVIPNGTATITINFTGCPEGPFSTYFSITPAGQPGTRPAFPSSPSSGTSITFPYCNAPGNYQVNIFGDSNCYQDQTVPFTLNCSNISVSVNLVKKRVQICGIIKACDNTGLPGATVTVGGHSTGTGGDGSYCVSDLEAGCQFPRTVSAPRFNTFSDTVFMGCTDFLGRDVGMFGLEAAPYWCASACCKLPVKLKIVDAQGSHDVPLGFTGQPWGGGQSECITATKRGYPVANDFGGIIGIICSPTQDTDGHFIDASNQTIAYKYLVTCNFTDTGGSWTVSRIVPGCYRRPVPFPTGEVVPEGYFPVAAFCGTDGYPHASSGATQYYGDGGTQASPHSSCAPFTLNFTGSFADLGDFQLVSE